MRAIQALLAAFAVTMSGSALAKQPELETRAIDVEFESPDAGIDELHWLVGEWRGPGVQGLTAYETWTAPVGNTMVGTFIQETSDRRIMFTELMYIIETADSLVLSLKHFNPDLTSWEEKNEVERYRLIEALPCAAFFNGLTIRCANPAAPQQGIVVAVRAGTAEDGTVKELVFRYQPAPDQRRNLSYGCDGTTFAINQCLARIRDQAAARESRYFEAAVMARTGLPARMTEQERDMRSVQSVAEQYRKLACADVYEHWKDGTIRNAMMLRCEIRLIDKRTQDIWQNWLTFQDSSEPILPEPEPSR